MRGSNFLQLIEEILCAMKILKNLLALICTAMDKVKLTGEDKGERFVELIGSFELLHGHVVSVIRCL